MRITQLIAREILDSRGNPTVEAEVVLENGIMGRAAVPSGASTGSQEAVELRDKDPKRYMGKGVLKAVHHITGDIQAVLTGLSVLDQAFIDGRLIELDSTANKSAMGANALLAVSMASARARANALQMPLYRAMATTNAPVMPVPLMNVVNGGVHADNTLDIQEFMIVPTGAVSFSEALRYGTEVYHALKGVLKARGLGTAVGDEGGFAPNLPSNEAVLDTLMQAIAHTGLTPGVDIFLALDIAASELYREGRYQIASEQRALNNEQFALYLEKWVDDYPIISIEDAMHENDWEGFKILTELVGHKIQLVGDDLFVTNTKLLARGIEEKITNAILIKPNQIGTVTETLATIQMAQDNQFQAIISHRSGETEDTLIADLSVATGAGQIKTGAPCRTDRVAKYNQLLRIEEASGFPYAGNTVFTHLKKWKAFHG